MGAGVNVEPPPTHGFESCIFVPAAREPGRLILASTLGRYSHHVEIPFAKELGDKDQEQEKGAGRNIYQALSHQQGAVLSVSYI